MNIHESLCLIGVAQFNYHDFYIRFLDAVLSPKYTALLFSQTVKNGEGRFEAMYLKPFRSNYCVMNFHTR